MIGFTRAGIGGTVPLSVCWVVSGLHINHGEAVNSCSPNSMLGHTISLLNHSEAGRDESITLTRRYTTFATAVPS
jgi:hypothetical protein